MKIDYSKYPDVLVKIEEGVLTLTLNSPENNNAFPAGMHYTLSRIWDDIMDDPEVRVVVLTGAGKTFSGGGDAAKMQRKIDNPEDWDRFTVPEARRLVFRMLECDKPIIARINGDALGLGATIALLCDISVMSETARIGDSHVKVGLVAGDGGALIWPQLIGLSRAKEYLMLGELIPAPEAWRIGLVNHVVPPDQLDEKVYGIAAKFARGASRAIRGTKQALNMPLRQTAHALMDLSMSLETYSHLSDDHQEAVHGLVEKRRPRFTGR